jgi:hypothetical protein
LVPDLLQPRLKFGLRAFVRCQVTQLHQERHGLVVGFCLIGLDQPIDLLPRCGWRAC